MQPCARSDLIGVLPLGVAFNRAGKRRLIWDGSQVNAYLREEEFSMETLQRESRALFGDARYLAQSTSRRNTTMCKCVQTPYPT